MENFDRNTRMDTGLRKTARPNVGQVRSAPVMRPRSRTKKWPVVLLLLIIVLGAGAGYYFFVRPEAPGDKLDTGAEAPLANIEAAAIIERVGEIMVLPENEEPTVATVTDPRLLADQVFFAKAKAGDKVLIYTSNRKAILYDPVAHKIVEVAPLSLGDTPEATSGTDANP